MEEIATLIASYRSPHGSISFNSLFRDNKRLYIIHDISGGIVIQRFYDLQYDCEWRLMVGGYIEYVTMSNVDSDRPTLTFIRFIRTDRMHNIDSYTLLGPDQYVRIDSIPVGLDYPVGIVRNNEGKWVHLTRTRNYVTEHTRDSRSLLPINLYPSRTISLQINNEYVLVTGVNNVMHTFNPYTQKSFVQEIPLSIPYDMESMLTEDIILLSSYEEGTNILIGPMGSKVLRSLPNISSWTTAGDGKTLCELRNGITNIYEYAYDSVRRMI